MEAQKDSNIIAFKIDGKPYFVDIKTSNSIHDSHKLQFAAYAVAWQEWIMKNRIPW